MKIEKLNRKEVAGQTKRGFILISSAFILLAVFITINASAQVMSGTVLKLRNQCSNKLLDVSGISTADGAKVQLWRDVNGNNQKWKIEAADNDFYRLTAMHSGKVVDVNGFGSSDGSQVIQWSNNNQLNQQWKIIFTGNGFYKLEARHAPGKVLDVNGASGTDGAKIQIWTDNGSCAQRWKLEPVTTSTDPVQTLIDDMTTPHEGRPHGVPSSYNWAINPRVGMGNNPGAFRAMVAWGQLYEAAEGNPSGNTRVQLRNIKAYYLSKSTGQWRLLQESLSVYGAAYREDFAGDESRPADQRYEPDGSISVTAGGGYNYHFWTPSGRSTINPSDIGGIWTTLQGRLILNNPNLPDDRLQARYLLSMGGDYWLNLTAPWDNWQTNGDIGIGKFKYVRNDWQSFNMTTLTREQLRQNPPPIVQ